MTVEQRPTAEYLSPAELSEAAYNEIGELGARLKTIPEFREALVSGFFSRSLTRGGITDSKDPISFAKGGQLYIVEYGASPKRFSSKYAQNYDVTAHLRVSKHAPESPLQEYATLSLFTTFTEDEEGEILKYEAGSINIVEFSGGTIRLADNSLALERIKKVFSELYPQPTVI